ncbi:hypothetical protein U1Q18_032952, partial [Sarracenia purpurea var. burkii]
MDPYGTPRPGPPRKENTEPITDFNPSSAGTGTSNLAAATPPPDLHPAALLRGRRRDPPASAHSSSPPWIGFRETT